jgi:hypothetical protein
MEFIQFKANFMLIISISIFYLVRHRRLPIKELRSLLMTSFKTVALLLPLLFLTSFASAAGKWSLKKDCDGIKIYTATVVNSDVKAIRAELTTNGTPAQLAAIIMDIDKQKDWVYCTETSTVLKRISSTELIYYTEKDMPWPVINRDAVLRIKVDQNITTHVMTISLTSVNDLVSKKKDIIRVPSTSATWVVTPLSGNSMKIEYEAQLDPGGSVPAWVVNMFTTKGPFETFKKLKEMLG